MPYKSKEERLEYHRQRYQREKEKLKQQALARYYRNREHRLEKMAEWREENQEQHRLNARLYHWEHREEQLKKMQGRRKQWYDKNREAYLEKIRGKSLARYYRIRKQVFDHYGNVCICCGETNQNCFTIDHIDNDGAEHRRELYGKGRRGSIYDWLVKHNFPEGFQLLCYNCNCARPKGSCKPHRPRPISEHWFLQQPRQNATGVPLAGVER